MKILYLMDKFFFWHSAKNNLRTYVNIRKSSTCQGDDYTAECLQTKHSKQVKSDICNLL